MNRNKTIQNIKEKLIFTVKNTIEKSGGELIPDIEEYLERNVLDELAVWHKKLFDSSHVRILHEKNEKENIFTVEVILTFINIQWDPVEFNIKCIVEKNIINPQNFEIIF